MGRPQYNSSVAVIVQIVVNHLTRMQAGYICVAGVDISTNNHVRPTLAGRLGTDLLRRNGGPFDIGCLVDIGRTTYTGHAPEVEDFRFRPEQASYLHTLDPSDYWGVLESISHSTLTDIFGDQLEQHSRSCTVDVGMGIASLGCLKPPTRPRLYVNAYGKVRINLSDNTYTADLSVTDLRLCETDHQTPRRELITQIDRRITEGEDMILGVGLTRPFCPQGSTKHRHWLQVNNIHLENDPIWSEKLP